MTNAKGAEVFERLLNVCDQLLSPEGCPWDREQTLVSMRESVLEEACEVIEAIDEGSDLDLIEELGDLLYNVIFFCKLAEKEGRFKTQDPILNMVNKIITRHPHVFGDTKINDVEGVISQWERIKKEEKSDRESLMDGIPKGMPALARAYKISGKMIKSRFSVTVEEPLFKDEKELGALLWKIVSQARKSKINPEMALRKEMLDQERTFRIWEKEDDAPATP
jgi:tetrapyrrole methylase family protein/MazG family protein